MKSILYIHGMGGGRDSRIPNYLSEVLPREEVRVIIRTYDFDPERGREQILGWVKEVSPDLVIGESLGALQALRIKGIPHLFVSPSLGAAGQLFGLRHIAAFAFGRWLLHRKFPVKEGDRQELKFTRKVLSKYREHGKEAFASIEKDGYYFAFFGKQDHYMRSGVVKISVWEQYFGRDTYRMYDGSHFMEEEYVNSMLVPKIKEILGF